MKKSRFTAGDIVCSSISRGDPKRILAVERWHDDYIITYEERYLSRDAKPKAKAEIKNEFESRLRWHYPLWKAKELK